MEIGVDVFDKYTEMTDLMLTSFGNKCFLVYHNQIQPIQTPNSLIQKKVMNLQQSSDKNGFARANDEFKIQETREEVKLRLYWDKKDHKKYGNLDLPDGSLMTISDYSGLSKINRCVFLVVFADKEGLTEMKFEKACQAMPYGLNNSQLVCFWKRV
jgi:hypothetical protein